MLWNRRIKQHKVGCKAVLLNLTHVKIVLKEQLPVWHQ